jgi:hypothetical protein
VNLYNTLAATDGFRGDTAVHSPPDGPIPLGLYDLVITRVLEARLATLDGKDIDVGTEPLDPGDSNIPLADHLRKVVCRELAGLPLQDRVREQINLCNRLIAALHQLLGDELVGESVATGARRLVYLRRVAQTRHADSETPDTPLGQGCLLTGTRLDPSLVSQLRKEIGTADRVDILCSFIKWSGVRILQDTLRAFTAVYLPEILAYLAA